MNEVNEFEDDMQLKLWLKTTLIKKVKNFKSLYDQFHPDFGEEIIY